MSSVNPKGNIQRVILKTLAVMGIIGVALLAPNIIQSFAKLGLIKTKRQKEIINHSRDRLIRAGFIAKDENGFIKLTLRGKAKLRELELLDYKLPTPKHWDKKWRMLIFDIPERRKQTRNKVRNTLVSIGFKWLQDSVWVYPYACEDLVTLLKADFKIGKDLLYVVADSIENDHVLRNYFELR